MKLKFDALKFKYESSRYKYPDGDIETTLEITYQTEDEGRWYELIFEISDELNQYSYYTTPINDRSEIIKYFKKLISKIDLREKIAYYDNFSVEGKNEDEEKRLKISYGWEVGGDYIELCFDIEDHYFTMPVYIDSQFVKDLRKLIRKIEMRWK